MKIENLDLIILMKIILLKYLHKKSRYIFLLQQINSKTVILSDFLIYCLYAELKHISINAMLKLIVVLLDYKIIHIS